MATTKLAGDDEQGYMVGKKGNTGTQSRVTDKITTLTYSTSSFNAKPGSSPAHFCRGCYEGYASVCAQVCLALV